MRANAGGEGVKEKGRPRGRYKKLEWDLCRTAERVAICSVTGTARLQILQELQELQMSELCREKKCRITV